MPDRDRESPGTLIRFASEFPERFEAVIDGARGALGGIEAAATDGRGGEGLLDPESLRLYHEIYRLRIELELETAAVLWRAAEVTWALVDMIEAVDRTLKGGTAAAAADSVAERREAMIPPPSPVEPGEPQAPTTPPAPADKGPAHRLWAEALARR